MTGRRMGRCTGNVPANENPNRTADASFGEPEAPPAESINQPVGMGMARRRGFGGGGGRGRGGFGRGRGRGGARV